MYRSLKEIEEKCRQENLPFWKVVQEDDCHEEALSEEDSFEKMRGIYRAMRESDERYDKNLVSHSGLVGTDAEKVHIRREEGKLLCDNFTGLVMERALQVAESNACMKRMRGDAGCPSLHAGPVSLHGGSDGGSPVRGRRHRRGNCAAGEPCWGRGGLPGRDRLRLRYGSRCCRLPAGRFERGHHSPFWALSAIRWRDSSRSPASSAMSSAP